MSQERLPPPPPACLVARYGSSQRGGTLVAEDVDSFEVHRERLCRPDGYRPSRCLGCLGVRLHVHDYRQRRLRGEADDAVTLVVRYACYSCDAIWLVLPRFIARLLRRTWRVVETCTLGPAPPPSEPRVPARTRRRWAARLASASRHAAQVLATSGEVALEQLAGALGLDATRSELVLAYVRAFTLPCEQRLASVAALLHRLAPGVRLM